MNIVILAHEKFPDRAKTAIGVLRYADYNVLAVVDREHAGTQSTDHVPDVQSAPIVESMADVPTTPAVDALLIGIAPIGGGFEESWRSDVKIAMERGCDIYSGLHYLLSADDEFATLAEEYECELWDIRKPPEDLSVADGTAGDVDSTVVTTVGTDCSVGKMTATRELYETAIEDGIDAAFVATGQTGILIEGAGIPVDRVISDFTAGTVEQMVVEAGNHDLVLVEGQGSIVHPAYSGVTAGIVHGARPDYLVLCHEVGRESVHGYDQSLPPISSFRERYESFAAPVCNATLAGGMLNTRLLDSDAEARNAIAEFSEKIGVPADDPVRFGPDSVLEAVL